LTDHPDQEQLAAFQAGDGDRRQRAEVEAHLAGCPSCAEVVASVEGARGRLALLEEPDLPPGLHDRLAAAVDAEAARSAADRTPSRLRLAGRVATDGPVGVEGRRERAVPWYRRPVAWGAAAALLLAALVAVPLLDRSTELSTAGGGQAAQEAGGDAAAGGAVDLPVVRLPGEVTAAAVRARLATDYRARMALEGTYKGRPATVLVTTSSAEPGRADLWIFPRDDCSTAPLATERLR
jgi:hypothetical protein